MSNPLDDSADSATRMLEEILNRVDQLPLLDSRSPDEIIGYDEHGIPTSVTPPTSAAPARNAGDLPRDPDVEDCRKAFGQRIPDSVKEFLEYRHREWELGRENNAKADEEAQADKTGKHER